MARSSAIIVLVLGTLLPPLAPPSWAFNPWDAFSIFSKQTAPPTPIPEGEVMSVAVAPFSTKQLPAGKGRDIQHKIAEQFKTGKRMKVIELSRPVSMETGGKQYLEVGFKDAAAMLAQCGADLIVWGFEGDNLSGEEWNIYVTAGDRIVSQAKEEGFSFNSSAYFSGVTEYDIPRLLGWVFSSWHGLVSCGEGMDVAGKIKPMISKTDAILGLAYEKHWDHSTVLQIKENLSVLLCLYGTKTHDVPTLERAINLTGEVLKNRTSTEDTHNWAVYQNNLGTVCYTLGSMQGSTDLLRQSCRAYREALRVFTRGYDPDTWAGLELNLSLSLMELAQREPGVESVREAIRLMEKASATISPDGQTTDWIQFQDMLGCAYRILGERQATSDSLRASIRHFEAALSRQELKLLPVENANVETNTGSVYSALGIKEQSVADLEKALTHTQNGLRICRTLHGIRNLSIILSNLGIIQENLGRLKNDQSFYNQACTSYQEAARISETAKDFMQSAKIRNNLGMVELYMAEREMKKEDLLKSRGEFEKAQGAFQKKDNPGLWVRATLMIHLIRLGISESTCDLISIEHSPEVLQECLQLLNPQTEPQLWVAINNVAAGILLRKGVENRQAGKIRESIGKFGQSLELLGDKGNQNLLDGTQGELCRAYAELLALEPGKDELKKAGGILSRLNKGFGKKGAITDRELRLASKAQLVGAIAAKNKDVKGLEKAYRSCGQAVKILKDNGYVYYAARKQEILGDMDLAFCKMGKGPAYSRKAVRNYLEAQEVLKNNSPNWEKVLQGKIKTVGP